MECPEVAGRSVVLHSSTTELLRCPWGEWKWEEGRGKRRRMGGKVEMSTLSSLSGV
jgi:hypothetical protein